MKHSCRLGPQSDLGLGCAALKSVSLIARKTNKWVHFASAPLAAFFRLKRASVVHFRFVRFALVNLVHFSICALCSNLYSLVHSRFVHQHSPFDASAKAGALRLGKLSKSPFAGGLKPFRFRPS